MKKAIRNHMQSERLRRRKAWRDAWQEKQSLIREIERARTNRITLPSDVIEQILAEMISEISASLAHKALSEDHPLANLISAVQHDVASEMNRVPWLAQPRSDLVQFLISENMDRMETVTKLDIGPVMLAMVADRMVLSDRSLPVTSWDYGRAPAEVGDSVTFIQLEVA
jgi:hypothetical protein